MGEITEHERLFGLIFSLCVLNESTEIDIARSYLCERLHKSERTINYWVSDLINDGLITQDIKRGRGARCTYKLNAQRFAHFLDDKTRKILLENAQLNAQQDCAIKGLPHTPSMEYNYSKNKFNNNIISSFDASAKGEEDGQKFELFRDDEEEKKIDEMTRASFHEFWKKFAPEGEMTKRYQKALIEWSHMTETFRSACLAMLDKVGKPQEKNPYFYLQHFAPVFLNDRQQYNAWKQHVQLCRVRYEDQQQICSAWMASIFCLEVLDEHYERIFEK